MLKAYHSGNYQQQYMYKCFVSSKLDEPFEWRSDAVLELLSRASHVVGALNNYVEVVPDVNFFIEMHKVKEATTSSRIEGTQTNIDEAITPEKEVSVEKREDWQEVHNYIAALNHAMERFEELPLSMRMLKEAHKILLAGVRGEGKRPGEVRTSQNWIGGINLEHAVYIPPHPQYLSELLSDLEMFWHDRSWNLPHLIRIAISHYQFEAIHPFLDGNGRIGRLLIMLQMLEYGLLSKPVFYISAFIEKHKATYYDALIRVTGSSDMDQWLRFFLSVVIETSENSLQTLMEIDSLQKDYRQRIEKLGRRAGLANQLVTHMYSTPMLTPRQVEHVLGVVAATANALLKEMESAGLIREVTGNARNRSYVLHEYIELFKK